MYRAGASRLANALLIMQSYAIFCGMTNAARKSNIDCTLPRRVELTVCRPGAPFWVTDLGELSIAGYLDVRRPEDANIVVPQPLILHQGKPAVRPYKYPTAVDHTYFTFDRRVSQTNTDAPDVGRLVISSASRVLVPDDPSRPAFVQLYPQDMLDFVGFPIEKGVEKYPVLFAEAVPYEETVYRDAVVANPRLPFVQDIIC